MRASMNEARMTKVEVVKIIVYDDIGVGLTGCRSSWLQGCRQDLLVRFWFLGGLGSAFAQNGMGLKFRDVSGLRLSLQK